MSNHRKTSPRNTARRDRAEAFVRDFTADGALAIIRDYAAPGTRCCWCDCPWALTDPASPHNRVPGYTCPELCTATAAHVVTVRTAARAAGHPVCERHVDDAETQILKLINPAQIVFAGLDSFG